MSEQAVDSSCRKCKAAMRTLSKAQGIGSIHYARITITGYICEYCGHWNDLKRRKGWKESQSK